MRMIVFRVIFFRVIFQSDRVQSDARDLHVNPQGIMIVRMTG